MTSGVRRKSAANSPQPVAICWLWAVVVAGLLTCPMVLCTHLNSFYALQRQHAVHAVLGTWPCLWCAFALLSQLVLSQALNVPHVFQYQICTVRARRAPLLQACSAAVLEMRFAV
jgi:hypothetical protein